MPVASDWWLWLVFSSISGYSTLFCIKCVISADVSDYCVFLCLSIMTFIQWLAGYFSLLFSVVFSDCVKTPVHSFQWLVFYCCSLWPYVIPILCDWERASVREVCVSNELWGLQLKEKPGLRSYFLCISEVCDSLSVREVMKMQWPFSDYVTQWWLWLLLIVRGWYFSECPIVGDWLFYSGKGWWLTLCVLTMVLTVCWLFSWYLLVMPICYWWYIIPDCSTDVSLFPLFLLTTVIIGDHCLYDDTLFLLFLLLLFWWPIGVYLLLLLLKYQWRDIHSVVVIVPHCCYSVIHIDCYSVVDVTGDGGICWCWCWPLLLLFPLMTLPQYYHTIVITCHYRYHLFWKFTEVYSFLLFHSVILEGIPAISVDTLPVLFHVFDCRPVVVLCSDDWRLTIPDDHSMTYIVVDVDWWC